MIAPSEPVDRQTVRIFWNKMSKRNTDQTSEIRSESSREVFESLPENLLDVSVSRRAWNGVIVEVARFRCAGRVSHRMFHENETRLNAVLEEIGSPCEPRLREDQPCPVEYVPRHMYFAPAGLELWGYSADARFVKDATLTFDPAILSESLSVNFDFHALETPRLRFADDRIWTLVKLLADAVDDPDPAAQLYGDGLVAAIAARTLVGRHEPETVGSKGLTPWQLRRVTEYLNAHLSCRIELAQLAALVGLSQSHFSRAFKAATGKSPYQWQLDARIQRAQALMITYPFVTLDHVAEETGFADAAHFGRTFRKNLGVAPGAWRKDRSL
jgi:AraC family transcriptional regulator